jgi:hypothetical protein
MSRLDPETTTDETTSSPFQLDRFHELVDEARGQGYSFASLTDAASPSLDHLYLRHDVDISPARALRLGEVEADLDVTASFFFQLNADVYNAFASDTIATIQKLRAMGHDVGLHIDEELFGTQEEDVLETLDWFDQAVTDVDPVVSFHRPSGNVLGRRYEAFLNAYDPRFFHEDRYVSDSRRDPAFRQELSGILERADGDAPVQILLHPGWWQPFSTPESFWADVVDRRCEEVRTYIDRNFTIFTDGGEDG